MTISALGLNVTVKGQTQSVNGATSSEGIFSLFMLKSCYFLKIDYRLLKIDFFLDYRF